MVRKIQPPAGTVIRFSTDSPLTPGFQPDESSDQFEVMPPDHRITIRQCRIRDYPAIRNLNRRSDLSYPASSFDRPRLLPVIAHQLVAAYRERDLMYVAIDNAKNECRAALKCHQSGNDERHQLDYLLSHVIADENDNAVSMLIERAIRDAGRRGARRVMASADVDGHVPGLLRRSGFSAYSRESVFVAPVVPRGTPRRFVCVQNRADIWGVQQLYTHTTPRDVQNAEAFTSHEWEIDLDGKSRRGYYFDQGQGMTAFVRVQTMRQLYRLNVLFLPEAREDLREILHHVFHILSDESPRPIFVVARSYQTEVENVLRGFGFEHQLDQLLMIKYTAAPAWHHQVEAFEPTPVPNTEPGRVPSFYLRKLHE